MCGTSSEGTPFPVSKFAFRVPCTWTTRTRSFFYGTGRGTGFSEGTRDAFFLRKLGAGDGIRTRNPQLGKLMRYRCATPAQESEKKIIKALRPVNLIRVFRGNPRLATERNRFGHIRSERFNVGV